MIERICRKLSANDRQAWHNRHAILSTDNRLISFRMWLCDRAAGYLNHGQLTEPEN